MVHISTMMIIIMYSIILIVIKAIITIVLIILLLLFMTRYVTGLLHERELAMRREQQGLHPWSAILIKLPSIVTKTAINSQMGTVQLPL